MRSLLICIGLMVCLGIEAQDSYTKQQRVETKDAVLKISSSLEQGMPGDTIARNFEEAAFSFLAQQDYRRAEDYFSRAAEHYQTSGDNDKAAQMERELGKIYEQQEKREEAIAKYTVAAQLTQDAQFRELNQNDINRLNNITDLKLSVSYLSSNVGLLKGASNKRERSLTRQQMAQTNLQMDKKEEALENLEEALEDVKDIPQEAIRVEQQMAKVLVANEQVDKAIDINERILEEAKIENDSRLQIKQLQTLSTNYVQVSEEQKAIEALEEAYRIAVLEGHTLDAKNTLVMLADKYKEQKDNRKALDLYAGFLSNLDSLIKADSTLIDERFFQAQEERIARMEKERELQDELLRKQYTFNNVLLVSVFLIFMSLVLLAKALYSINKKNKKIALQSLRREMNPHFIFNSLNSVNHFIAQNKEIEANRYLTSYSRLMRTMMEHSNQDFVALSTEIEQLNEYLELERMRFPEKFIYRIEVDESFDTDALYIPNMLIQPHLENAIWHGLRYLESDGVLFLRFINAQARVLVEIEDNGIGLTKSQELKTGHQKSRQSRGQKNTMERIELLNSLYGCDIQMEIREKEEMSGVIVSLSLPIQMTNHE